MQRSPDDAVMRATYRALCEHGYANLTMQDIADETELSKAALHYHYDTKRELLEAFLDSLSSWFEARIDDAEAVDAEADERLNALVEECLSHDDTDYPAFRTAMLEVKAQAPYEPSYRDRLQAVDDLLHERVRDAVGDGIDAGTVRATVDPDCVARFVVTYLSGAHTRSVAVGGSLEEAREDLLNYLDAHVYAATTESESESGSAESEAAESASGESESTESMSAREREEATVEGGE